MEYFANVMGRLGETVLRVWLLERLFAAHYRASKPLSATELLQATNMHVDDIIKHMNRNLVDETDPDQEGTIRGTIQDPEPADSLR